jgi:hypothetical protein
MTYNLGWGSIKNQSRWKKKLDGRNHIPHIPTKASRGPATDLRRVFICKHPMYDSITTQIPQFAVCPIVCCGPNVGHTANITFAVSPKEGSRHIKDTRQTVFLPCVSEVTHDKGRFCRVQPSAKKQHKA